MSSPPDRQQRAPAHSVAPDEPKRPASEVLAARRDMKLLEAIRKLRRDRAETAMRDARDAVLAARLQVDNERTVVAAKVQLYQGAQAAVATALGSGRQSLYDIRKLLGRVDRSRDAAHQAHSAVAMLQRDQRVAEGLADEALRLTRAAAAAHEKVLEWKRSV